MDRLQDLVTTLSQTLAKGKIVSCAIGIVYTAIGLVVAVCFFLSITAYVTSARHNQPRNVPDYNRK
jgi:hypothetical protein